VEVVSSAWHVISAALIFVFGALVADAAGKLLLVSQGRRLALYVWHTGFCLLYCWYALNNGGDAITYFIWGESTDWNFNVGTRSIEFFAGALIHGLGLSLLGVFLVFNILGCIGLLAVDSALNLISTEKPRAIRLLAKSIVFLPSISFWTSALGKDAIAFMATGLALWSAINLSRHIVLMAFSIALMLLVRPHIAAIMVFVLIVSVVFDARVSPLKKAGVTTVSLMAALVMVPFVFRYAGFQGDVSIGSIADYVDKRQSYNMDGGGGVDIASMAPPMQMFSYIFRPMLFEARTIFEVAAAIDNFILLVLFILGLCSIFGGRQSNLTDGRAFMWMYVFCVWLVMAMTTANLGIALRQKWMFVPMLIVLLISVVGRSRRDSLYIHPDRINI